MGNIGPSVIYFLITYFLNLSGYKNLTQSRQKLKNGNIFGGFKPYFTFKAINLVFFENGQWWYTIVAFGLLFFKVVKTFTGVGGFLMMHNFTSGHHLQHHRISCFLKATQNVTKVFQIFGMGIDIAGKIRKIGF